MPLLVGYGQSETPTATLTDPGMPATNGMIGRPMAGNQVAVVDAEGREIVGDETEVLVLGSPRKNFIADQEHGGKGHQNQAAVEHDQRPHGARLHHGVQAVCGDDNARPESR